MSTLSVEDVTVLHVDDEPGFAQLVADFLEREDGVFSVLTTTTVTDALPLLANEDIDCIVSDYDMPGKDGLEFLELVRDEHPDLPFILFTGRGSEQITSRAISAGVTDYLQEEGGMDQYTLLTNRVRDTVRTHRAETARMRTEERYHQLVDTAPIPIVLFDKTKRAVYSNDAAVAFLNAESHAALEGTPFVEFLHADDREPARERFETLMREDRPLPEVEFRIQAVDGTIKSAIVATAPGYYHGEKVAQAMVYRSE